MHLGSKFTFCETAVRPLHSDNGAAGFDLPTTHDFVSVIDLQSVLKSLFHDAVLHCDREGKLQQRAWLSTLCSTVGRGGKVKFQDYGDWMWHPKYEVTDAGWTELKLTKMHAMPMAPHK